MDTRNKKQAVFELQSALRILHKSDSSLHPSVIPDGHFGKETEAALLIFQKEYGLSETGKADYESWTLLLEVADRLTLDKGTSG